MGFKINTNITSLIAQKNLEKNAGIQDKVLQRLSSGSRIVSAGDDAAGLSISQNLEAQRRGLVMAKNNANNSISLVQTAEGGMNEVSNIIIRMRELGVQAASDTIGNVERGFIQKEVGLLSQEVDRIAQSTNFNGTKLLNGSTENGILRFQIGTYAEESNQISFDASKADVRLESLGMQDLDFTTREGSLAALTKLDESINHVNSFRAELGATQNRIQSTVQTLNTAIENTSQAKSRIADADIAEETANLAKSSILTQASSAVLAQANALPQNALKLL